MKARLARVVDLPSPGPPLTSEMVLASGFLRLNSMFVRKNPVGLGVRCVAQLRLCSSLMFLRNDRQNRDTEQVLRRLPSS